MIFSKFMKKYDVPILFSLILLPLFSLVGLPIYIYHYGMVWQEPVLLFVGSFFAGTGITIGYHRLFAHRAFVVLHRTSVLLFTLPPSLHSRCRLRCSLRQLHPMSLQRRMPQWRSRVRPRRLPTSMPSWRSA